MPLPFTACTFSPRQRPLPDDRDGGLVWRTRRPWPAGDGQGLLRLGLIFGSGRYSGPTGGRGNRQETGYRLPGATGELDGAE